MRKPLKFRKIGMLPGALIHTGNKKMDEVELSLIHYDIEDHSFETYSHTLPKSSNWKSNGVNWINIDGLHDVKQIKKIGETFDLHHLLLEDVLSVSQ